MENFVDLFKSKSNKNDLAFIKKTVCVTNSLENIDKFFVYCIIFLLYNNIILLFYIAFKFY